MLLQRHPTAISSREQQRPHRQLFRHCQTAPVRPVQRCKAVSTDQDTSQSASKGSRAAVQQSPGLSRTILLAVDDSPVSIQRSRRPTVYSTPARQPFCSIPYIKCSCLKWFACLALAFTQRACWFVLVLGSVAGRHGVFAAYVKLPLLMQYHRHDIPVGV